jgi:hypothetical protein
MSLQARRQSKRVCTSLTARMRKSESKETERQRGELWCWKHFPAVNIDRTDQNKSKLYQIDCTFEGLLQ